MIDDDPNPQLTDPRATTPGSPRTVPKVRVTDFPLDNSAQRVVAEIPLDDPATVEIALAQRKKFTPKTQALPRPLTHEEFTSLITRVNDDLPLNETQFTTVLSNVDAPCYIVAGPGSGKTTVLVYRILKFLFMDGLLPEEILATTFTRKAARELKGKIIEQGYKFILALKRLPTFTGDPEWIDSLTRFDLNRIIVGTLDSICEEVMVQSHLPNQPPTNVVDEVVAHGLFRKETFWPELTQSPNRGALELLLKEFTSHITNEHINRVNLTTVMECLVSLHNKIAQEQISTSTLRAHLLARREPALVIDFIISILDKFHNYMVGQGIYDYALLEEKFLAVVSDEHNLQFPYTLRAVLVDEYQDTNFLQEQIYFNLARRTASGQSITVVGDDDQSMYRFRGAVVNLIREFPIRIQTFLNLASPPEPHYLMTNYRSTQTLIDFYNSFLSIDRSYILGHPSARIADKPLVMHSSDVGRGPPPPIRSPPTPLKTHPDEYPILVMLRDSVKELGRDLAQLISDVFQNPATGYPISHTHVSIKTSRQEADNYSDIVFLCSTPQESNSQGKPTLIRHLRDALQPMGVPVFNPRGSDLYNILEVQQLLGLLMECLDPSCAAQNNVWKPDVTEMKLNEWRATARALIALFPDLQEFVTAWQTRTPSPTRRGRRRPWPQSFPIAELLYKLTRWIDVFESDPEYMLYLEAIVSLLAKVSDFSRWNGEFVRQIRRNGIITNVEQQCVESYFKDFFVAIANKELVINEDLIEIFPKDRVNVMSIHQSKGLEFPMVIVDVCSAFPYDIPSQRFRRFPDNNSIGGNYAMEDYLEPILKSPPDSRSTLDHTFDDLIRLYFVAYSRPQSLLLLVGIKPQKGPYSKNGEFLPNLAVGYDRVGHHPWSPVSGTPPWKLI